MKKISFLLLLMCCGFFLFSQNVGVSDNNLQPKLFFHLHSQNYVIGSPLLQITNGTSNSIDSSYGFSINFNSLLK